MKITCGEMLRKVRKKIGISQEAFADKIGMSTRQLSRIETNKADISILDLLEFMKKFDVEIGDLKQLYMDSAEYEHFLIYEDARNYLAATQFDACYETVAKLEGTPLWGNPHIQQFIAFVKILESASKKGASSDQIFDEEDVKTLSEIISMTIKDFDEEKVSEYLLTYHEFHILLRFCEALSCVGEHERARKIGESLRSNKTVSALRKRKHDSMYVQVGTSLTEIYQKAGAHTEALGNAIGVFRHCLNKSMLHDTDYLNARIARAYREIKEEEAMYMPYIYRAYYWAVFLEDDDAIAFFRRQAKDIYNTKIE